MSNHDLPDNAFQLGAEEVSKIGRLADPYDHTKFVMLEAVRARNLVPKSRQKKISEAIETIDLYLAKAPDDAQRLLEGLLDSFTQESMDSSTVNTVFSHLIEKHGANPLLFDRMFTDVSAAALNATMCHALYTCERRGLKMRDDRGLTIIDRLLEGNPLSVFVHLKDSTQKNRWVDPEWLYEAHPSDGRTLLHRLWSKPGNEDAMGARWQITHELLRLGARPWLKDHNGVSAAGLMLEQREVPGSSFGEAARTAVLRQLDSQVDTNDMLGQVKPATAPPRKRSRL